MSPATFAVLLLAFVLVMTWRTIYIANKDLVRAKLWKDVARRSLPFGALLLMSVSLPIAWRNEGNSTLLWLGFFALLIAGSSIYAVPAKERRATRAFRKGDFEGATKLFGEIAAERPIARNHAFHGAALGASERLQESVDASTRAVETDPEYGLAYYNRALVLLRMDKKSRARKDFQKAQEVDMPRRFKKAAGQKVQELEKA